LQEKADGGHGLLSWENKGGPGVPADACERSFREISASRLFDAVKHVDEMTVFEQRRLLRQAADEIWKTREEFEFHDGRFSEAPNDLASELRLMAEHILRTPHPLVRLAFQEAAVALQEFECINSNEPVAH
jgi:hypothetical protein